jgi:uncharacterized linocin/CFP29 family protein
MADLNLAQSYQMFGDAADRLLAANGDLGVLRPWIGRDGRSYVARQVWNERTQKFEGRVFTTNTATSLSYDAYKQFDTTVIQVLRERLRAVADVRGAGLVYNLPNGMAHTVLAYQKIGDFTRATVSMDPSRRSEMDRPESDIAYFPLPIVHKDFDISARELMSSRLGLMPLDTTNAALAARKVSEEMEDMLLGTVAPFKYAGNYVYGYRTLPERATKFDLTTPTGSNGATVIGEILALRQLLINDKHYGPYVLYVNSQWSTVLDNDFSTLKGADTLRQRILRIDDITDVRVCDRLPTTNWECLLVELKTETVRMVMGTEVQTVQWESQGGMMRHFKVMAMQPIQLRGDTAGNSGVAHGATTTPPSP